MIRHIVLWRLKADDAEAKAIAVEEIREAIEALPATIPQIRSIRVHGNVLAEHSDYDAALIGDFDDQDDLNVYLTHPDHVAVSGFIRERVTERAAVDIPA